MPAYNSCLLDGGAWKATVHGVAAGHTRLSDFPFTFHFHALEKEMAATRSLMLSMQRGSCAATQQLKNPTNCPFLTSDRARIAVALGSLETLDPNPSQCRPGF